MRFLRFLPFFFIAGLTAQVVTVTAPTALQSVSGVFNLGATCTSCPSLYSMEYDIGDEKVGLAYASTSFQLAWNTYGLYNGTFNIVAIARDALNVQIGSTSSAAPFTVANPYYNQNSSPGYGQPSGARSPSVSVALPASPWTGTISIPVTVTGATAGEIAAGITYIINVGGSDPSKAYTTVTSATPTLTLDSTRFYNGIHLVSVLAYFNTGGLGPFYYGQAKQNITTSNGSSHVEIVAQTKDYYFPVGVGDTYQLAPVYNNADLTTSAISSPTYSVTSVALNQAQPVTCTVSGSGLVTLVNSGIGSLAPYCIITISDGVKSDAVYFYWLNGLNVLHFASDSSIRSSYVGDGKDLFLTCPFFGGGEFPSSIWSAPAYVAAFGGAGDPAYSGMGNDFLAAKFNCVEVGGASPVGYTNTYSTFTSNLNLQYITPAMNIATSNPSLFIEPVFLSYLQGNDVFWEAQVGPAASYSPYHATTALFNAWNAVPNALAVIGGDEFNTAMGTGPLQGAITVNNSGPFTAINCRQQVTSAATTVTISSTDCGRVRSATNSTTATYNIPTGGTLPTACIIQIDADGTGNVTIPTTSSNPIRNVATGGSLTINAGSQAVLIWNSLVGLYEHDLIPNITSGTVCTVQWVGWQQGCAANKFVIQGATSANINNTPGDGGYRWYFQTNGFVPLGDWGGAGEAVNQLFFHSSLITTDADFTAATDPSMRIEYNACWWMNPANGTTDSSGDIPGGGSAGNYTSYLDYAAWSRFVTDMNAATGRKPLVFPVFSHTPAYGQYAWMSNPALSGNSTGASNLGFAHFYWADANGPVPIDPTHQSRGFDMRNAPASFAGEMRWRQNIMQQPRLFVAQTAAISLNWSVNGYQAAVGSCTNETCNIPRHGLTDVIPGVTRLQIQGSSNSAYNTTYFVISAPDANTIKIANSVYTPSNLGSAVVSNQGTIHWEQSGTTSTFGTAGSVPGYGVSNFIPGNTSTAGCTSMAHQAETFSVSNSGDANVNALRFWYAQDSGDRITHTLCAHQVWRPLPSGSTTGGSAYIIPNNYNNPGFTNTTGPMMGPRQPFFNIPWAAGFGAAGIRSYSMSTDTQRFYPDTTWGSTVFAGVNAIWTGGTQNQSGVHPRYDNGAGQISTWHSLAQGSRFVQRFVKYLFQSKMSGAQGPDYGQLFDTGAPRCGAIGCLLMFINVSDNNLTRTTPNFTTACGGSTCLQAGQSLVRFTATWDSITYSVIAAGTTSDTMTMPPGSVVWYLFPANFANELRQPTLGINLGSVSGATQVVVRWSYDPYTLDLQAGQATDCGSGLACTLPVDQNFGSIFYRIIYRASDGHTIVQSDIQTL